MKILKILKLFFGVIIAIIAGVFYISSLLALRHAPWAPSKKKDLKRIIKAIDPKPGETIYELGSGDGRVCAALGKKAEVKIIGVELSLLYYFISLARIWILGLNRKVNIQWGNFYKENLAKADKVFFYLTKKGNFSLKQKIFEEMKRGSKIITYNFPIIGLEYIEKLQENDEAPIYIYEVNEAMKKLSFGL